MFIVMRGVVFALAGRLPSFLARVTGRVLRVCDDLLIDRASASHHGRSRRVWGAVEPMAFGCGCHGVWAQVAPPPLGYVT